MYQKIVATAVFCFCSAVAVTFQVGLALGLPWGDWAMAGRYPGRWPARMRFVAWFQAGLLLCLGTLVAFSLPISAALPTSLQGLGKQSLAWIFGFSCVSAILNTLTPARKERMLWAPITWLMALSSGTLTFLG